MGKYKGRFDLDPAGYSCISLWNRTARTAAHTAFPDVVSVVPGVAGLDADAVDVDSVAAAVSPGIVA